MTMDNIRKKEPSEELRQPRRNISRSSIMAIIIITALLTSLSVIVLTDSTTPKEKPIDVFGQSDDSVDAAPAQVYISNDNNNGPYDWLGRSINSGTHYVGEKIK